jgi:hypothetical protein
LPRSIVYVGHTVNELIAGADELPEIAEVRRLYKLE